jgi:hypothetical protein
MARVHRGQPRLDVVDGAREIFNELRAVVESDDKELVLRICRLDELQDRLASSHQLGRHGAGKVENDADRNGGVLAGKATDLLFAAVFIDLEVVLLKAGDQPVHGIGDGDRHQHHIHIHADKRTGMQPEGAFAGFRSCFGSLRLSCRGGGRCRRLDVHLVQLIVLRAGRRRDGQERDHKRDQERGRGKSP